MQRQRTAPLCALEMSAYLQGEALYGNHLSGDELRNWYAVEEDRYVGLVRSHGPYRYIYHALNERHAWRHLPRARRFERVLGVGSAWGDEFAPVAPRIGRITLVDVAEEYKSHHVEGVPVNFVRPGEAGDLPLPSESFDLVVCFAALQHIATVSHVILEMARCVAPGGYMCLRDSIVSGNFHERVAKGQPASPRGIPWPIFDELVQATGLQIVASELQVFSLLRKLWRRVTRREIYLSPVGVTLDATLSRAFAWNYRYHASRWPHHLRPASRSYVLHRSA